MEAHLKRCFVTGGVILGFMKHAPLTAHGGGGGGKGGGLFLYRMIPQKCTFLLKVSPWQVYLL